jgi:hypothetical protein
MIQWIQKKKRMVKVGNTFESVLMTRDQNSSRATPNPWEIEQTEMAMPTDSITGMTSRRGLIREKSSFAYEKSPPPKEVLACKKIIIDTILNEQDPTQPEKKQKHETIYDLDADLEGAEEIRD